MKSEYLAEVKVITIPNYAIGLIYFFSIAMFILKEVYKEI